MSGTVMVYSYPGPHKLHGIDCDYVVVPEDEAEAHLKAGYSKTPADAKEAYEAEFGPLEDEVAGVDAKAIEKRVRAEVTAEFEGVLEEHRQKIEELEALDNLPDEDRKLSAMLFVIDHIDSDGIEFVADKLGIEYTNKADTLAKIKTLNGE